MQKHLPAALAVLALLMALPSGAATHVYVRVGPPAAVAETRVAAPSTRHVWIAGYHRWDGKAYVWVPGQWELPPGHNRAWVSGHWTHAQGHGWYWVDGHWRR